MRGRAARYVLEGLVAALLEGGLALGLVEGGGEHTPATLAPMVLEVPRLVVAVVAMGYSSAPAY